jgi:hypothetical protein
MKKPMLALSAILLVSFGALTAQVHDGQITDDPLIGTWNISGINNGSPGIAVTTFNAGGTTVEFDSGPTVPTAAETIALGKWYKSAEPLKYTFSEQNYIYEPSGNLAGDVVTSCSLTLASNHNSFTEDSCTYRLYACDMAECPGALIGIESSGTAKGKRF